MSAAEKYIQFHEGPHQMEISSLPGKEATFGGIVAEALSRKVLEFDEKVRVRVRTVSLICATSSGRFYQVDAEGTGDACFTKGERVSFEYDAVAQQSEEIPLT